MKRLSKFLRKLVFFRRSQSGKLYIDQSSSGTVDAVVLLTLLKKIQSSREELPC